MLHIRLSFHGEGNCLFCFLFITEAILYIVFCVFYIHFPASSIKLKPQTQFQELDIGILLEKDKHKCYQCFPVLMSEVL